VERPHTLEKCGQNLDLKKNVWCTVEEFVGERSDMSASRRTIRASAFLATSLDGFIARKDGSVDWLDKANLLIPAGEDCGFAEFMESVDTIVMGRVTFEKVVTFDKWFYGTKPMVVLSTHHVDIPSKLQGIVTQSSEGPKQLCDRLSAAGVKRIYVDGGITIQRFLNEGMLDDMIITLIPVLIGEGKPLFGPVANDVNLRHLSTKTLPFGFVQLQYSVDKV
jgi:dihydrofolate reductase